VPVLQAENEHLHKKLSGLGQDEESLVDAEGNSLGDPASLAAKANANEEGGGGGEGGEGGDGGGECQEFALDLSGEFGTCKNCGKKKDKHSDEALQGRKKKMRGSKGAKGKSEDAAETKSATDTAEGQQLQQPQAVTPPMTPHTKANMMWPSPLKLVSTRLHALEATKAAEDQYIAVLEERNEQLEIEGEESTAAVVKLKALVTRLKGERDQAEDERIAAGKAARKEAMAGLDQMAKAKQSLDELQETKDAHDIEIRALRATAEAEKDEAQDTFDEMSESFQRERDLLTAALEAERERVSVERQRLEDIRLKTHEDQLDETRTLRAAAEVEKTEAVAALNDVHAAEIQNLHEKHVEALDAERAAATANVQRLEATAEVAETSAKEHNTAAHAQRWAGQAKASKAMEEMRESLLAEHAAAMEAERARTAVDIQRREDSATQMQAAATGDHDSVMAQVTKTHEDEIGALKTTAAANLAAQASSAAVALFEEKRALRTAAEAEKLRCVAAAQAKAQRNFDEMKASLESQHSEALEVERQAATANVQRLEATVQDLEGEASRSCEAVLQQAADSRARQWAGSAKSGKAMEEMQTRLEEQHAAALDVERASGAAEIGRLEEAAAQAMAVAASEHESALAHNAKMHAEKWTSQVREAASLAQQTATAETEQVEREKKLRQLMADEHEAARRQERDGARHTRETMQDELSQYQSELLTVRSELRLAEESAATASSVATSDHETTLAQVRAEHAETLRGKVVEAASVAQEASIAAQEYSEEKRRLARDASATREAAVRTVREEARSELEASRSEARAELERTRSEARTEVKTELEDMRRRLISDHEVAIEAARTAAAAEGSRLESAAASEHEASMARVAAVHAEKWQGRVREAAHLAQQATAADAERQRRELEISESARKEVKAAQDAAKIEVEAARAFLVRAHGAELDAERDTASREFGRLRAVAEAAENATASEHEAAMAHVAATHAAALKLRAMEVAEVARQESATEMQQQQWKRQVVESARKEREAAVKAVREEAKTERTSLEAAHATALEEYHAVFAGGDTSPPAAAAAAAAAAPPPQSSGQDDMLRDHVGQLEQVLTAAATAGGGAGAAAVRAALDWQVAQVQNSTDESTLEGVAGDGGAGTPVGKGGGGGVEHHSPMVGGWDLLRRERDADMRRLRSELEDAQADRRELCNLLIRREEQQPGGGEERSVVGGMGDGLGGSRRAGSSVGEVVGAGTSGLGFHSLRSPGTPQSISPAPHTAPRWRSQHRPRWEPLHTEPLLQADGGFEGSWTFAATSPPAPHASTPPPGRSSRAQSSYASTPGGPQYGYSPPSRASEDTTDFIISHAPHLSERFSYSAPRAVRPGGGTLGRPYTYANRMFWSDRKEERERERERGGGGVCIRSTRGPPRQSTFLRGIKCGDV
jgi:hypothetical protein